MQQWEEDRTSDKRVTPPCSCRLLEFWRGFVFLDLELFRKKNGDVPKYVYFCRRNNTNNIMTAKEKSLVKKQTEELLKLLLKKTNTTHQAIVRAAEEDFIIANLDVLTATERKQFDKLVLN